MKIRRPDRRPGAIAGQLRAKGHDVLAVVTDPGLIGLPDDQIPGHATGAGRALVTANIKDFMPLDARYRAASQTHPGLILVSTRTFPQDRNLPPPSPAHYQPFSASQTRSSPAKCSSSRAGNSPRPIRSWMAR